MPSPEPKPTSKPVPTRKILLLITGTGLYVFVCSLLFCLSLDDEGNFPAQWVWLFWTAVLIFPLWVAAAFWRWVADRKAGFLPVFALTAAALVFSSIVAMVLTAIGDAFLARFPALYDTSGPYADIEMRNLPLSLLLALGMMSGTALSWLVVRSIIFRKR